MPSQLVPPASLTWIREKGGDTTEGLVTSLKDIVYVVVKYVPPAGVTPRGNYALAVTTTGKREDVGDLFATTNAQKPQSNIRFSADMPGFLREDGTWKASPLKLGDGSTSQTQLELGKSGTVGVYAQVMKSSGFEEGKWYKRYLPDNFVHLVNYEPGGDAAQSVASAGGKFFAGTDTNYWVETASPQQEDPNTAPNTNTGAPLTTIETKTFVDKGNLQIETNLRMLTKGFGTPRAGRAGKEAFDYGVKWRSGLIHTSEWNPAYEQFPHMYGFRFHYNPTSWTQNVAMVESIDVQNVMGSRPTNLPLMGGWAGIGLTVFVNRIIEMSMSYEELLKTDVWYNDLARNWQRGNYGNVVGTPESRPEYLSTTGLGGLENPENRAKSATLGEKVEALMKYGTLADIEYLFKTVNGRGVDSYHRRFAKTSAPLGLDGKPHSLRTADYGFLSALPVRVWLGPNITFIGRITSVSIQHLMFTELMVPKYSQVQIEIRRPLTWGSDPTVTNQNFSDAKTKSPGENSAGILLSGTGQGGNTDNGAGG